jgi:hypothetical protein
LEIGAANIQLTLSDRPRPPRPPANDDLEASRELVERGLRGIGAKMGGALRGALEKSSPKTPAGQSQKDVSQKDTEGDPQDQEIQIDDD